MADISHSPSFARLHAHGEGYYFVELSLPCTCDDPDCDRVISYHITLDMAEQIACALDDLLDTATEHHLQNVGMPSP